MGTSLDWRRKTSALGENPYTRDQNMQAPLGGTFGASITIKINKDGQTGGGEDSNGKKKSQTNPTVLLDWEVPLPPQDETFCSTSLSDDIRDTGDPS